MFANLAVAVAKIALGYYSGTVSIISDGFHSLTDTASNVVGLVGVSVASRPPDANHPYGHRKYETMASVGIMILVLGMQLERATRPERASVVATAVALSIGVTPVIGWGYAHLLGLAGPAFQAAVIQASMPAAVVTTILALQYEVAPNFVTSVVVVSTLLSPFTLTCSQAACSRGWFCCH